jgi:NADPH:quinone reductase-like Zn-dependent oxidoreductase
MKAILIDRYGPPDVLEYRDRNQPIAKGHHVLVNVMASSVNPIDCKIRGGDFRLLSGFHFPKALGSDVAGTVEAVGEAVEEFKPGDEVFGFSPPLNGGAYADYIAISAENLTHKPPRLSFIEAAAAPLAGLTAMQALLDLGKLRPGLSVLVNGASGGVGSLAVQLAKAFEAQVTGVCSGRNQKLVADLGADQVIDYTETDFTRQDLPNYDLIFDAVGKRSFSQCSQVLTPQGIYISTLPSLELFAAIAQTFLLPGPKAYLVSVEPNSRDLKSLAELLDSGKVKAIIDRTYPLTEIAQANRYSESQRAAGKIVITVRN